ncbi:TniB family NTP-binding protein [Aliidiomarina shirensis]|nr:TniB family NTP-binding protein [Aliidiomarina shirensis]
MRIKNTQSITSGLMSGAQKISSLALWNHQFCELDNMVDRLLRFHGTKPSAMSLIAREGAGKTHFALKKQEQFSKYVIDYGDYTTMPVLITRAPKQSTVRTFVERILYELGDIKPSHGSADEKEKRLLALLRKREVKLIVIDEIHDFLPKTSRGRPSTALAWLKGFMDETLIPILFMGTERAGLLHVIDKELASRIRYSATLASLPYGNSDYSKFDFAEMASAFAEHLACPLKQLMFVQFDDEKPIFSNMNLLDRFFVATDGVPRGLRDIFLEINLEMEDDADFTPNLESLSKIYKRMTSMNDFIDFDPFGQGNLTKVQNYINKNCGGENNAAA